MTDEQIIKAYEGLTPRQQLNLYRNLYYEDGNATERGVVANAINDILPEYERQKAEIKRLIDLINEIAEANEDLARDNHDLHVSLKKRDAEIERFADIGKMYSEVRAEAIREFAEKIDQLLNRYSNLHKHADKAMESTEKYDDGTPIEMVSVYEVLSLEKWEMVDYETMSELQGNIETIAKERLLSELEKDFRLLVKEMTEGK